MIKKYLHYYCTASNGKGHGIHSPFVYDFVKFVLNDNTKFPAYDTMEQLRKRLLKNDTMIEVEDFGAGSTVIKSNSRQVSKIAASSLKSKKYAQLLHRMVRYYKPATVVELGTSFGITTCYLASACNNTTVYSLEGAPAIAHIATTTIGQSGVEKVKLIVGDFEFSLPALLHQLPQVDFAFVDGNHRKGPTLKYFRQLLQKAAAGSVLVFDDIHWSVEMEEAWNAIKLDPAVTLTIDLFIIGLVFINPDFKVKQDFVIRF